MLKSNVFCLALISSAASGTTSADLLLNAAYDEEDGSFTIDDVAAQTFSVELTGTLSLIESRLGRTAGPEGDLFVFIRDAESGFPSAHQLGVALGVATRHRADHS